MECLPVRSRIIAPGDDIASVFLGALKAKELKEGDVVAITSKVLAVAEGRLAPASQEAALMQSEADVFFGGDPDFPLALKGGHLTAKAGIDRSNAPDGQVILWPEDPWYSATTLRKQLRQHFGIRKLGVIICDSFCRPLRTGVMGEAIAFAGFMGIRDRRDASDLYGKKLMVTQTAAADALAASAGLLMGDADERVPFVIIRGAPVIFTDRITKPKVLTPRHCLFAPLYSERAMRLIEDSGIPLTN